MNKTSDDQQLIINDFFTNQKDFYDDINNFKNLSNKTKEKKILLVLNALYREGVPFVTDDFYDDLHKEYSKKYPLDDFVQNPEPEYIGYSKKQTLVKLPQQMLSTDKAYSHLDIQKWLDKMAKAFEELKINEKEFEIRITPKLDGFAAFYADNKLITRGNGQSGQDVTFALKRGLSLLGKKPKGAGEVVIEKEYFLKNLSLYFENSRNIQAAILAPKNIDQKISLALKEKKAVFFPFASFGEFSLEKKVNKNEVLDILDEYLLFIKNNCPYDIDGLILEVTSTKVKSFLGATAHHNRWQIAYKEISQSAITKIINISKQVGRTGRITPVLEIEPILLSGAKISKVSGHNFSLLKKQQAGVGSKIKIIRSGLVIPKLIDVLEKTKVTEPQNCPSCNFPLKKNGVYLVCENHANCKDQILLTLEYFFKTLANLDGFGNATLSTFYQNNVKTIFQIYQLQRQDLLQMGFKDKTIINLLGNLNQSKIMQVDQARFIAAFGIERLGINAAKAILNYVEFDEIFNLSVLDIEKIAGFATKSANAIYLGLQKIKEDFLAIKNLGFNLKKHQTLKVDDTNENNFYFFQKNLIFSGVFKNFTRTQMEQSATEKGACVVKSISKKTNYLIIGEKVGQTKLKKAQDLAIKILNEIEYFKLC